MTAKTKALGRRGYAFGIGAIAACAAIAVVAPAIVGVPALVEAAAAFVVISRMRLADIGRGAAPLAWTALPLVGGVAACLLVARRVAGGDVALAWPAAAWLAWGVVGTAWLALRRSAGVRAKTPSAPSADVFTAFAAVRDGRPDLPAGPTTPRIALERDRHG